MDVRVSTPNKNKTAYPKLMRGINTGIIFLMRTKSNGFVIDNNYISEYNIGHSCHKYGGFELIDEMIDFEGEITIKN